MDKSKKLQRKQKTQYRDQVMEVEVELQGKSKVPSNSMVLPNRESVNDGAFDTSRLLEEVLERNNMLLALKRVISNKGSHGVDGMKTDELREHIKKHWETIKAKLLESRYNPSPVRRKEISKPDGGIRLLGIPTVQDRLIQQAIAQVLSKIYDPLFSENSFGFRPRRGAKDAITKSKQYINQGNRWVVDMDLEKFFDRVNHDILMWRLARIIKDERLLKLIRRYLEAEMVNGQEVIKRKQGMPQGGPLSPLLSNILLDELDKELERRGHRFCRYADDCNIYVSSRKAGEQVLRSVSHFLEKRLKLQVNGEKSAVARPWERKFLGYSFTWHKAPRLKISSSSVGRLKDKIRSLTTGHSTKSVEATIRELTPVLRGWISYFRWTQIKGVLEELDGWIRRKLRCLLWRQWKRPESRVRMLMKAGLDRTRAKISAYNQHGAWWNAGASHMNQAYRKRWFEKLGLVSLLECHQQFQR